MEVDPKRKALKYLKRAIKLLSHKDKKAMAYFYAELGAINIAEWLGPDAITDLADIMDDITK